jgi:hypothetical protein
MGTKMRSPAFLLYKDTPKMDMWLKLLLGIFPVMFLVLGCILLFQDKEDAFVMFGLVVFYPLLFKIVMPQRYQIYNDKLRIVFSGPFAWNIPFSTVKEVRSASGAKAFAYGGVRFATSSKNVVEIRRSRGCNVVISPSNKDVFLEQAGRAMKSAGHS